MIVGFFALNTAFAVAVAIIYGVSEKKTKRKCYTCKHLIKHGGGGIWKFYCAGSPNARETWPDGFDKPPKYCKYYEPREANK